MQLSVVVDSVHGARHVLAMIMREVHRSLLVVEGADVHDARRCRAFNQV